MSQSSRAFLRPVGGRIRDERSRRGLTIEALAKAAGVSKGLLSKIENFRAVPSLPVLASLARALDLDLATLVADVQVKPRLPYLLVRHGEAKAVRREAAQGMRYLALPAAECGGVQVQSFTLQLDPGSRREPCTTDGDELLFALRGTVSFILGDEELQLHPGDALYFDGRLPHAPLNRGRGPAELLVIYLIPSGTHAEGTP